MLTETGMRDEACESEHERALGWRGDAAGGGEEPHAGRRRQAGHAVVFGSGVLLLDDPMEPPPWVVSERCTGREPTLDLDCLSSDGAKVCA